MRECFQHCRKDCWRMRSLQPLRTGPEIPAIGSQTGLRCQTRLGRIGTAKDWPLGRRLEMSGTQRATGATMRQATSGRNDQMMEMKPAKEEIFVRRWARGC